MGSRDKLEMLGRLGDLLKESIDLKLEQTRLVDRALRALRADDRIELGRIRAEYMDRAGRDFDFHIRALETCRECKEDRRARSESESIADSLTELFQSVSGERGSSANGIGGLYGGSTDVDIEELIDELRRNPPRNQGEADGVLRRFGFERVG